MSENINQQMFNAFRSGYSPYGDGTNSQSAITTLSEGWAYHLGHYFTDERYGNSSSDLYDDGQQASYYNGSPTAGLSSHLNLLENFNPNSATAHFKWIPKGLFYDLNDTRNDFLFDPTMTNDQVSGYTNQQLFNAFQSNIYTLQDFRIKLLQTTTNSTSAFVPNLFSQYGY